MKGLMILMIGIYSGAGILGYAGVGLVMTILGLAMIVFSVLKLSSLRAADRRHSVEEFTRQFVTDTRSNISDIEAGARRRELAARLGIGQEDRRQ